MASSIASLFGPTAEEIVYDRNQAERIRQQTELQQSLAGQENQASRDFYQSGYNIAMGVGKGLSGMFGYTENMTDPRIAKSVAMRKVFSDLSAEDLNDPSKIAMISQLADEYDLPELKLWTADRERELIEEESTRQKRINDAAASAMPTIKGEGIYEFEGEKFFGHTRNGVIYRQFQDGSAQPAQEGALKAKELPAVPASTGRVAELTLAAIEEHPKLNNLSSEEKKKAVDFISGASKQHKGLSEPEAINKAIDEAIESNMFKEGDLNSWQEIKKFVGADPEVPLVFDRYGKAVLQQEEQSEAPPEAQQQTKSIEELSKMYDPDKLRTDSLDNSIWLVDDEGNPIQKVSN